jgi:hypothetical protein
MNMTPKETNALFEISAYASPQRERFRAHTAARVAMAVSTRGPRNPDEKLCPVPRTIKAWSSNLAQISEWDKTVGPHPAYVVGRFVPQHRKGLTNPATR